MGTSCQHRGKALKRYYVNWPVFIMGNFYGLLETAHFGWNVTPGSPAEVIADGIAILIVALSIRRTATPNDQQISPTTKDPK
jgi:hypothetical protein